MKTEADAKPCDEWEIKVAKSFEEVEAVRDIWKRMQRFESAPILNTDIDRYLAVVESVNEAVQPCVMVLYCDGAPKAMVIGRLERQRITCRVGYTTVLNPSMRCLSVIYGGVLGQLSDRICVKLLQEIVGVLKQGDADVVFFNRLRLDSPLYNLARTTPSFLCRCHSPVVEPHWQTHLPDSIEAFYKGKLASRKRYLKRYSAALENACSGPVEMVRYSSQDKLDYVISAASEMSAKTYKHALDVGFRDDCLTRSLLTEAARRGQLRAYVLYAGGKACAFEFGFEYGNTFFPEHIGYDPALSSCSPGTVLFIKVLEDLIQDSDVSVLDYGFGAATYKERFGTRSWPEASVYVFAPRVYPVLVNMLRSSMMGLSRGMAYVLDGTGLTGWTKRRWRNLLQAKNSAKKLRVGR